MVVTYYRIGKKGVNPATGSPAATLLRLNLSQWPNLGLLHKITNVSIRPQSITASNTSSNR
jgi:hypothetical protein